MASAHNLFRIDEECSVLLHDCEFGPCAYEEINMLLSQGWVPIRLFFFHSMTPDQLQVSKALENWVLVKKYDAFYQNQLGIIVYYIKK